MATAVRRYVESGECEAFIVDWPGDTYLEREIGYRAALRQALLAEVRRRAGEAKPSPMPDGIDLLAFTRTRVAPMVDGLFSVGERETVLRESAGLPHTRTREWLLEIEFRKRETFAYSCEAFSRIRAPSRTTVERRTLFEEYAEDAAFADERVDGAEVVEILREAVGVRKGWKRILNRCAPVRRRGRWRQSEGAVVRPRPIFGTLSP